MEVSTALGRTIDPEAVGRALRQAREAHASWYVQPEPEPAEPGSLDAIAERFRARMSPGFGLSAQTGPPPARPEDRRAPAPRPEPPTIAEAAVRLAQLHNMPSVGLKRVDPPKKGD